MGGGREEVGRYNVIISDMWYIVMGTHPGLNCNNKEGHHQPLTSYSQFADCSSPTILSSWHEWKYNYTQCLMAPQNCACPCKVGMTLQLPIMNGVTQLAG